MTLADAHPPTAAASTAPVPTSPPSGAGPHDGPEAGNAGTDGPLRLQRARGAVAVSFKSAGGRTRLDRLYQDGCGKARLPRTYDGVPVAVLLNTAGGVTGGDEVSYRVGFGAGTRAVATTQAAERIYRRAEGLGRIVTRLEVGPGADAAWLPQETIVFDRAGLDRRLDIEMAGDARLLAVEAVVLGRTAMGETVREASIADHWRLVRAGRLVYADSLRLSGDVPAALASAATGRGAGAMATVLLAAPDAESRLAEMRDLVEAHAPTSVEAGVSAFDGLLVARFLAPAGRPLRDCLVSVLENFRGTMLPAVWRC
jgi:Urease accessory protein UreH